MGVFEDFIECDGEIRDNSWIEWDHYLIPNESDFLRELTRRVLAILRHCLKCTTLDGCYFIQWNCPEFPQHEKCDCVKTNISSIKVKNKARSEMQVEKLSRYIFSDDQHSKGKNKIFYGLGFGEKDIDFLLLEYKKQALANYLSGNYTLKAADIYGQRISIPIMLNDKCILSGWIVEPEGKIRNITPFGGWAK